MRSELESIEVMSDTGRYFGMGSNWTRRCRLGTCGVGVEWLVFLRLRSGDVLGRRGLESTNWVIKSVPRNPRAIPSRVIAHLGRSGYWLKSMKSLPAMGISNKSPRLKFLKE